MADTVELLLDDDKAFEGFARAQVAMVVTNPHLQDNPIVYVNQAFTRVTGFARTASIGRNCRFLQGEDTEKRDVDRLRAAIEADEVVSVDILNYRANGEPFVNRLVVSPITDEEGQTQMHGQPIGGYIQPPSQPGIHHPPPNGALQATKDTQQ